MHTCHWRPVRGHNYNAQRQQRASHHLHYHHNHHHHHHTTTTTTAAAATATTTIAVWRCSTRHTETRSPPTLRTRHWGQASAHGGLHSTHVPHKSPCVLDGMPLLLTLPGAAQLHMGHTAASCRCAGQCSRPKKIICRWASRLGAGGTCGKVEKGFEASVRG